jgi:hypothetical protein
MADLQQSTLSPEANSPCLPASGTCPDDGDRREARRHQGLSSNSTTKPRDQEQPGLWVWVVDALGAAGLFITLFGSLYLAEIFR